MYRLLGRSVVVVAALVVGFASSGSGPVSAQTTRTPVTGFALQPEIIAYEGWQDRAGGWHIRMELEWQDFSLYGDGIDIQGSLTSKLSGNTDQDGNGVLSGTFVVREEAEVVWKGRLHGSLAGWIVTAVVTARGEGPFEGMLLQLLMEENDPQNPFGDEFDLAGWVLDVGR